MQKRNGKMHERSNKRINLWINERNRKFNGWIEITNGFGNQRIEKY